MEIEYIAIDAIKPYERNPRKNDAAVDSVAASIREFGFQQPIVCDTDGVIIVGHTRLKAAKKLGLKTVPVVYADLPEDKVKAYRLADNKTGELAEWDTELLDLELGDIDLDMSAFGFEIETDDGYGTEFDLADGDRPPVQNMTFTFSDDEAETIKAAISEMKQSKAFERYDNPLNENSNGRALFLVVSEWQARKT